jgi:hypothetical protein
MLPQSMCIGEALHKLSEAALLKLKLAPEKTMDKRLLSTFGTVF